MSDARLRALQRELRRGARRDPLPLLAARARSGLLPEKSLEAAAFLGFPPAIALVGEPGAREDLRDWMRGTLSRSLRSRQLNGAPRRPGPGFEIRRKAFLAWPDAVARVAFAAGQAGAETWARQRPQDTRPAFFLDGARSALRGEEAPPLPGLLSLQTILGEPILELKFSALSAYWAARVTQAAGLSGRRELERAVCYAVKGRGERLEDIAAAIEAALHPWLSGQLLGAAP